MSNDLILIDAFSQIFRCFYAVRFLSNSRGEPTNALLPFVRILLKLEKEFPNCNGALLFDSGKVDFRLEINPEYKQNRPPMPEALAFQIPIIRQFIQAFGWPIIEEKNYEADDLIGAIAVHSTNNVKIISSDKDLSQLIDERVVMMIPDAKTGSWNIRDIAAVEEKFKITPTQMVDYLSLIGDASDNIPGVAGVGPKTAAQLLNTHGSIAQIFDNIEQVANLRIRNLLKESTALLEKNRQLITLKCTLPSKIENINKACEKSAPDWKKVHELCDYWQLRSLIKELPVIDEEPIFQQFELFDNSL